jgi:general stress protein 26
VIARAFRPCGVIAPVLLASCLGQNPPGTPIGSPRAPAPLAEAPADELNLARDPRAVIDSARALMRADSNMALVTVDSAGRPRVRTVRAFLDDPDPGKPASGMTVWVMTRLSTRKIEQIRRHPQVALYFNADDQVRYATLMGLAVVHTDPGHPGARRHYDDEYARFFWPDFPRDFVMIEVRPVWLEYMGPGLWNDRTTWRPQAVVFPR